MRQMAPPPLEHEQPKDINRDNVMQVKLDAHDQLTCDDKVITYKQLTEEVRALALVNRTGHVVSIQAEPATTYEAYFRMQDAIAAAYHELRDEYAKKRYGHSYEACTNDEKTALNGYYPQRISESPIQEGGAQ